MSWKDYERLFFTNDTDATGGGGEGGDGGAGGTEGAPPASAGGDPSTEPDPVAEAVTAKLTAEWTTFAANQGLEGSFSSREEVETALAEARNRARSEQTDEAAAAGMESFREALAAATNDEEIAAAVDALQGQIRPHFEGEIFGQIASFGAQLLPVEAHDAFNKDTPNGTPINEWLESLVEHAAPHAKSIKNLDLEALVKLSPKAAAQYEEKLTAAKAAGFALKEHPAAQGQVGKGEGADKGVAPLTRESFLAMSLAERAQAMRERPAEVEALT